MASMGRAGRLRGERGGTTLNGAVKVDEAVLERAALSPATAADDVCPLKLRLSAKSAAAWAAPVEKRSEPDAPDRLDPTPDEATSAPEPEPNSELPLWLVKLEPFFASYTTRIISMPWGAASETGHRCGRKAKHQHKQQSNTRNRWRSASIDT